MNASSHCFSGTADLWPLLFAFNVLPSLLCLVLLPFFPESPRFLLIKKGEEEEARDGEFEMYIPLGDRAKL